LTPDTAVITASLVTGYYSGLFSGSDDKTKEANKKTGSILQKGIDVTKQWINKVAIFLAFPAIFNMKADELPDFAQGLDAMLEKKPEKKIELKEENTFFQGTNFTGIELDDLKKEEAISFKTDQYEIFVKSIQHKSFEDVGAILQRKQGENEAVVVAVFDGNGGLDQEDPVKIPRFLANNVPQRLANSLLSSSKEELENQEKVTKKIQDLFKQIDKDLYGAYPTTTPLRGSTACVAVLLPKQNMLIVANTGDSQLGVVFEDGSAAATRRHNPQKEERTKKLEAERLMLYPPAPVEHFGLALSRAFGYVKDENGAKWNRDLWVEPEVYFFDLKIKKIKGIVLGSDGLWDKNLAEKKTSEDLAKKIIDQISSSTDLDTYCKIILKEADLHNYDDKTIGIIKFMP